MPGDLAPGLLSTELALLSSHEYKAFLVQLEDALHELSQPLTALSIVLDMASFHTEAEEWQKALATARTECRRAVVALQAVRSAAFPEALPALHSAKSQRERTL